MEHLLYNGLGGLRKSADKGSLLHDTRPYAAKKREERDFARARAAHRAAHSENASAYATTVHPLADYQVVTHHDLTAISPYNNATTPSRAHAPFSQTGGDALEVCESLSPSKVHEPGNAVPVHELQTKMPGAACGEEEESASCALPARRTWDEGGATTGAVNAKGPCTPPVNCMAGLEPIEDIPAHPSLGSSWQAMKKRKGEDNRVFSDEDSDALACGENDDKENMNATGSWFCNARTPSTVIVSPIELDPGKIPLSAPHVEPANQKRRRGFQTNPLGHIACADAASTPREFIVFAHTSNFITDSAPKNEYGSVTSCTQGSCTPRVFAGDEMSVISHSSGRSSFCIGANSSMNVEELREALKFYLREFEAKEEEFVALKGKYSKLRKDLKRADPSSRVHLQLQKRRLQELDEAKKEAESLYKKVLRRLDRAQGWGEGNSTAAGWG